MVEGSGRIRVGVRCLNCNYVWPTGLPDALRAARRKVKALGKPWPKVARRVQPSPTSPTLPTSRALTRRGSFTSTGELAHTKTSIDALLSYLRSRASV